EFFRRDAEFSIAGPACADTATIETWSCTGITAGTAGHSFLFGVLPLVFRIDDAFHFDHADPLAMPGFGVQPQESLQRLAVYLRSDHGSRRADYDSGAARVAAVGAAGAAELIESW